MAPFSETLPFTIRLESPQESVLHCEKLVRELPGKRMVFSGTWQDRPVIAKLYPASTSAQKHWAREKNGIEALAGAGVTTPQLLHTGQLADGSYLLVLDRLLHARTALQWWQTLKSQADRQGFLLQLVELTAGLHETGLVQRDLHLENFLVSGQQIFAIDGDSISVRGNGPLDLKTSSRNLALLYAQLPPKFDSLVEGASLHYALRRRISSEGLLARLRMDLPKVRQRRRRKYVTKCYRTCSEFIRDSNTRQVAVSRRDVQGETLYRLLKDPDAFMRGGELIKDGNSSTVVRVQADASDWIIKRYNIKNPWHAMKRCLRPSRAWVSWGNAHRLEISGIPTPRAIAMIEKRFGPFRSTGYYVCDYLDGPDAASFFHDEAVSVADKEHAADEFVILFDLIRKLGIYHGDCKASNFLLIDNTPWVLDLDAMREGGLVAHVRRRHRTDRQRFLGNWQSHPELLCWFDQHLAG
jgi:tRNA A-37 threonylcarbamoyl transferase component Bud32